MTISRLHPASLRAWRAAGIACLAAVCLTGCPVEEDPLLGPDAAPEDSFTMVYNAIGARCAGCHAPGAPGSSLEGLEATQDWSSRDSAYNSLQGMASGLVGNFADCNGVPFIGPALESSLILAAIDPDVRAGFSVDSCTELTISDMNLKLADDPLSDQDIALVRQWLMEEIQVTQ